MSMVNVQMTPSPEGKGAFDIQGILSELTAAHDSDEVS